MDGLPPQLSKQLVQLGKSTNVMSRQMNVKPKTVRQEETLLSMIACFCFGPVCGTTLFDLQGALKFYFLVFELSFRSVCVLFLGGAPLLPIFSALGNKTDHRNPLLRGPNQQKQHTPWEIFPWPVALSAACFR